MMRVLIVNTSERTGGAAVAANRLMDALNNSGVKAKMLVRDKDSDTLTVAGIDSPLRARWHFLWERLTILSRLRFSKKHLFEIDIANSGFDITRLREFQEADVVHLHWVNQGFMSLADIRKVLASGKPVVWTMHDAWPATAICHYTHGCKAFMSECRNCRLLPGHGSAGDLANVVWRRKRQMLEGADITFVACSRWLEKQAGQSALIGRMPIMSIPNPIDTRIYRPGDQAAARHALGLPADKKIVLFVSQRVTDERKGMDYLVEAMEKYVARHPEAKETVGVAILGGHAEELADRLALPVYPLGYVGDERKIVDVYRSADVFVLPSLEDNLPNTIMEAMACGVPCVGFRTGGIPEEIDHLKTGYVAEYRDADDLMRGIHWVIGEADRDMLREQALKKVATNYSQASVALRYIEAYNQAMAFKHYGI